VTVRAERLRTRGLTLRADLTRLLPSLVLAGYGIFILSLYARNVITLYINPTYVGPTVLAGVGLIGLAALRLVRHSEVACDHDDCCTDSCYCGQTSPRIWPYLVLCIPLLLGVLFPPRSLAAFSAQQRGPQIAGMTVIRGATAVKRVSLSVDTRSFTLQDWAGALSADPNPRDYGGKPIIISGLILHNPASMPPGYIMVMRYQVTCCIADARPVGLIVRDTSHGALKDNQWVKVIGTMGAAHYQGQSVVVVNPKQLIPIKAGNPYMY
jgi:uncharacterized repeat protein (TIGR03943 family)